MIFRVIAKIIYSILLIIETLISIRFVFKLVGASKSSSIVNAIYWASSIFVKPFVGIINVDLHIGRFFIDLDAVLALIIYMIAAFVVVELIKVFAPRRTVTSGSVPA